MEKRVMLIKQQHLSVRRVLFRQSGICIFYIHST